MKKQEKWNHEEYKTMMSFFSNIEDNINAMKEKMKNA
jgi:hypothetical protein